MKSDVLLQLVRVYLYVRQLLQDFYDSLGDSSSASDSKDHGRVLFLQAWVCDVSGNFSKLVLHGLVVFVHVSATRKDEGTL